MFITLDQARVFAALAKEGSLQAAARALHRQIGSIAYALKQLEQATDLELVDRSGYRLKLTHAGERVLGFCDQLLAAELGLKSLCQELKTGWEPTFTVICDGVFPVEPILRALRTAIPESAPTRVSVVSEFLSGVENAFELRRGDVMISVLPPERHRVFRKLRELKARLVVKPSHPLAKKRRPADKDLESAVLLTVRESDTRLLLPTARLRPLSIVQLNDFHAKRDAILQGMGYGWLPDHLCSSELASGRLQEVKWAGGSTHTFTPSLSIQTGAEGRALTGFLDSFV